MTVIGKVGQVTGRVQQGRIGEVAVKVNGETRWFNAYPENPSDVFETGTRVSVVDFVDPNTVYVVAYNASL